MLSVCLMWHTTFYCTSGHQDKNESRHVSSNYSATLLDLPSWGFYFDSAYRKSSGCVCVIFTLVMLALCQLWGILGGKMRRGGWRRRRRWWKTGRRRTEWTGRERGSMRITVARRTAYLPTTVSVVLHEGVRRKRHRPAICWYTERKSLWFTLKLSVTPRVIVRVIWLPVCAILYLHVHLSWWKLVNVKKKMQWLRPSSHLSVNSHHGFSRHYSITAAWSPLLRRRCWRLDVKLNG